MQECNTPYCRKLIPIGRLKRPIGNYYFCEKCRERHSSYVLKTQTDHEKTIVDILLDASSFQRAGGMADYLGVSFVTVYHWINKYFNLTFQEFRREYICKSSLKGNCYLLDIDRSSYSRNDYVLKKIRARRFCACLNALEPNLIMTNAPLIIVKSVLRGSPRIDHISDNKFALVPNPINFRKMLPIYFDLCMKGYRRKSPKRVPIVRDMFTFSKKVLIALHKMGGSARVDDLRQKAFTCLGKPARKNNTRREVYKHPEWFNFVTGDDQSMELTTKGMKHAEQLILEHKDG